MLGRWLRGTFHLVGSRQESPTSAGGHALAAGTTLTPCNRSTWVPRRTAPIHTRFFISNIHFPFFYYYVCTSLVLTRSRNNDFWSLHRAGSIHFFLHLKTIKWHSYKFHFHSNQFELHFIILINFILYFLVFILNISIYFVNWLIHQSKERRSETKFITHRKLQFNSIQNVVK